MIYKTCCISFPRSGYHALRAVLQEYFGEELKVCDNYTDPPEKRLLVCESTNFQKEHDLKLDYPFPGIRLLVLVRNPIRSIQSWIDFDARVCAVATSNHCAWATSFLEKASFWSRWFNRWVLSEHNSRLVVSYESLLSDPFQTCESVIQFMTSQHPDAAKLQAALRKFPIAARQKSSLRFVEEA